MSTIQNIIKALRLTVVLWLLTAVIYPLLILGTGQLFFPEKANGSMIINFQKQPIGSALIGQTFREDKYFHSRPSRVRYSQGKAGKPRGIPTGVSGASNLAPSNPQLLERITEQANKLSEDGIKPVADLVYASGSGLDPHISIEAAKQQIERVAKARGIKAKDILFLLDKYTENQSLFNIFGVPGVNVVRLNYALDLDEINRKQNQ